jgi:hypothetical protein
MEPKTGPISILEPWRQRRCRRNGLYNDGPFCRTPQKEIWELVVRAMIVSLQLQCRGHGEQFTQELHLVVEVICPEKR